MSHLRELLVNLDSIAPLFGDQPLTPEQVNKLERITQLADGCSGTLMSGMSAIGWCMAAAADNKDFGLNADELVSLGWLLQELGNLIRGMNDLSRGAEDRLSRSVVGVSA